MRDSESARYETLPLEEPDDAEDGAFDDGQETSSNRQALLTGVESRSEVTPGEHPDSTTSAAPAYNEAERVDVMMGRGEAPPSYDVIEDSLYDDDDEDDVERGHRRRESPAYREGDPMRNHRWFACSRSDLDKLPASVSRTKNNFRTAAVILQMGQAVLIVFSFVSNDMFIGLDQPQPTDSSWWANQGNLPRPHNCGLFRQCSTKACTFLVPGAQTVTYPDGYKELGASPPPTEAVWRVASGLMLVMLFMQLMKFKVVFAYIRFKTEWITARVALILRYACLIMSAVFTTLVTLAAAMLLVVHHLMGAGELGTGSLFLLAAVPLGYVELGCWLLGIMHFTCTIELDRVPSEVEEQDAADWTTSLELVTSQPIRLQPYTPLSMLYLSR